MSHTEQQIVLKTGKCHNSAPYFGGCGTFGPWCRSLIVAFIQKNPVIGGRECPRLHFKAPFPSQQHRSPSPSVSAHSFPVLAAIRQAERDSRLGDDGSWSKSSGSPPPRVLTLSRAKSESSSRIFCGDGMLGRSDCSEDKRGIDYSATTDFVLLSAEGGRERGDGSGMWAGIPNKWQIWIWYFATRIFYCGPRV